MSNWMKMSEIAGAHHHGGDDRNGSSNTPPGLPRKEAPPNNREIHPRKEEVVLWERVGNEQHPLGSNPSPPPRPPQPRTTRASSSASSSFAALPRVDAAMLLQSAARSVLDKGRRRKPRNSSAASASSIGSGAKSASGPAGSDHLLSGVSDFDDASDVPSTSTANNNTTKAATSPTLSSLQRKRLPALPDEQDRRRFLGCLAAVLASTYDYDVLDETDDVGDATYAENMAFLDLGGDGDEDAEDEGETETFDDDDDQQPHSLLEQTVSGSFEFSDVGDAVTVATSTVSTSSSPAPSPQTEDGGGSAGKRRRRRRKSEMRDAAAKRRLSRSRHRKRRYDVHCRLLLTSADYLMLEKSQAKAFVPMLARLLVPPQKRKDNDEPAFLLKTVPVPTAATANQTKQQAPQHQQRPPLWKPPMPSPSSSISGTTQGHSQAAAPSAASLDTMRRASSQAASLSSSTEQDRFLERISGAPINDFATADRDLIQTEISEIEHLQPFLESLTPGGGFRCLVLVLLRHLLHSPEGYDSRIRHALKTVGVILFVRDMEAMGVADFLPSPSGIAAKVRLPSAVHNSPDLVALATRRFESLEHSLAARLIELSREQEAVQQSKGSGAGKRVQHKVNAASDNEQQTLKGLSREQIVRGIKVGAMGVAAASLFAVTGGLAAPGIAAGVAAIAGGTAVTAAAAAVLTSTTAVTAIFGVGGGTLVAYKMNRRTQGLTEFEFRKETGQDGQHRMYSASHESSRHPSNPPVEAELFSTICLSGWLRDLCDFQRPWGVSPTNPWITDRLELLERFYSVYRPDHVSKCKKILKSWEGEEKELWNLLRQKYGRDPDNLFPLHDGPRFQGSLTLEQKEVVDQLFSELGYCSKNPKPLSTTNQSTPFERMRIGWKRRGQQQPQNSQANDQRIPPRQDQHMKDSLHGPHPVPRALVTDGSSVTSSGFESISTTISMKREEAQEEVILDTSSLPKHLATVWDYQSHYGGEMYTVRWEGDLLTELCDSVTDLAFDVVSGGTAQILKHTALSTLLSAIAWPYALVNAANMIDGTWTLVVERAEEAGRELARSLLFSKAGHRPVTLVGFSFGARVIYSCLKELARYQEKWSEFHERAKDSSDSRDFLKGVEDEGSDEFYRRMREPASIVEDVALLGLPNHLSLSSWKACRQVVAGRLVNCFSQRDLILSLMFQFKRLGLKAVCGTCPVAVRGVENIDVTDLVSGHQDYCMVTGSILKRIRFHQPFRSRPTRTFSPAAAPEDDGSLTDKFDV